MNTLISNKEKLYLNIIHQSHTKNVSIKTLCENDGISYSAVCRVKQKYKIKTNRLGRIPHNKRITKDVESKMIEMYNKGFSGTIVANHFGFKTGKTVMDILDKYKVNKKTSNTEYVKYNRDFFKKIDSHDKAYILGFIYADGYIYKNYEGFGIQLNVDDYYILEKMKTFFGESSRLSHINCDTKRKTNKGARDMCRLMVFCREMTSHLKNKGVIKNKTTLLSMPKNVVPKKYIFSFARGFIDGDGTMGVCKRGYLYCRTVGKSKTFAEQLRSLFPKYINIYNRYNLYFAEIKGGQKNIANFLVKLYKDKGDMFLRRKYARVKDKVDQILGKKNCL